MSQFLSSCSPYLSTSPSPSSAMTTAGATPASASAWIKTALNRNSSLTDKIFEIENVLRSVSGKQQQVGWQSHRGYSDTLQLRFSLRNSDFNNQTPPTTSFQPMNWMPFSSWSLATYLDPRPFKLQNMDMAGSWPVSVGTKATETLIVCSPFWDHVEHFCTASKSWVKPIAYMSTQRLGCHIGKLDVAFLKTAEQTYPCLGLHWNRITWA